MGLRYLKSKRPPRGPPITVLKIRVTAEPDTSIGALRLWDCLAYVAVKSVAP